MREKKREGDEGSLKSEKQEEILKSNITKTGWTSKIESRK